MDFVFGHPAGNHGSCPRPIAAMVFSIKRRYLSETAQLMGALYCVGDEEPGMDAVMRHKVA
jgi:hypothetical protein